jgi:hypothetical protein
MPVTNPAGRIAAKIQSVMAGVTPTREWVSLWGNGVMLSGKLIEAGTVITAKTAGGVLCGGTTAWADGKFGLMCIYKDNPLTEAVEGAKDGEEIVLTIGSFRVPKTIRWTENGTVIDLMKAVTGVAGMSDIPAEFALANNYPNPFNPSTTIRYQLPNACTVTLKIFDAIGREVTTLVNERKDAGYYQVQWNAAHYSSGIYFYTISAGEFVKTLKLQLVK